MNIAAIKHFLFRQRCSFGHYYIFYAGPVVG